MEPNDKDRDQGDISGGPSRASSSYRAPSIPTLKDRRAHLKRLALWATGAATVSTGMFYAAKTAVAPFKNEQGVLGQAASWLHGDEDPYQLAGSPPAPSPVDPSQDPFPRLAGEMVAPEPLEPTSSESCILPKPPPRDPAQDYPATPGSMPAPQIEEGYPNPAGGGPIPEFQEPEEQPEPYPEIGGDVAVPEHLPPRVQPPPQDPEPRIKGKVAMPQHLVPQNPLPPQGTSASHMEGNLRSVYLSGTTAEGEPFSVMIRLGPEDEDSYQAVVGKRREILTALAPLASKPELARGKAAQKIVQKLLPEASIRQAGVVR